MLVVQKLDDALTVPLIRRDRMKICASATSGGVPSGDVHNGYVEGKPYGRIDAAAAADFYFYFLLAMVVIELAFLR